MGGKALVALELRSGLAVARATAPDGETNDAKLVPPLLPQVRTRLGGPRLWVADRQFCELTQTAAFAADEAHFGVRYHPKTHFCPDPMRPVQHGDDPQGRVWGEDWGWLGCERTKPRRFVRRITLSRPGAETVSLSTDLLDAARYLANDLLALYLARWGIERVFQQITEVFHLQALIGTTPQGTVFQGAFCLLLYNLLQVVRAYVATAHARPAETISTALLFDDVQRQLVALTELVPPPALRVSVRARAVLREPGRAVDPVAEGRLDPVVAQSAAQETQAPDRAEGNPWQSDLGLSALGSVPSAATTRNNITHTMAFTAMAP